MPGHKAAEVLALEPVGFAPQRCLDALLDGLNTHCLALTGDERRDIDRVDSGLDDEGIFIIGYHRQLERVYFHMDLADAPTAVELTIRATQGQTNVYDVEWGSTGVEIGNSVLVARLLHVGICVLRKQGIMALENDPCDERLRNHYATMGFDDGRTLRLSDRQMLEQAFGYIEAVYRRFRLELSAPPP
jgi:hypothetical protein